MPGSISGPTPNRPYTNAGGISVRGNGVPIGVRDNLNFITAPGVRPSLTDDAMNDRVNISWELDTELLLSENSIDLTSTGTTTLLSAISFTRLHITKILVIITNFAGTISAQPLISAGTDVSGTNPNDDIVELQFLDSNMNTVDLAQSLTLLNPRPTIDQSAPTDFVRFVVDTAATGAGLSYMVNVQIYGVVITP